MRLPDVDLDTREFQDLVSESRGRIARSCPSWTDHNLSDPGITLIELWAWMVDMLVYRLNRVPEKLHIRLLELLDVRLGAATAARADVRFRLGTPATADVLLAQGTQVATSRTISEEAIVFELVDDFTIPSLRPEAYVVERGGERRVVEISHGTARPKGRDQFPFGEPPAIGDALYLGFKTSPARLLMQVPVSCSQAAGTGIDPEDPPLAWEVSTATGEWSKAEVIFDSTGGFNYGSGTVELQIPDDAGVGEIEGRAAYWLRCSVTARSRSGTRRGTYELPPEISSISAAPIGALVVAEHAEVVRDETLGVSDGTPAQTFQLRHPPVLALGDRERLQSQDGQWTDWSLCESFAESDKDDLHFRLDPTTGEIELGPAIRSVNGVWLQHGAIPPEGKPLRMTAYRHGGGQAGNVAANMLRVLRRAIPGVATVTNPSPAHGGIDAETLEHARRRAAMEHRTRSRAVTAEDYEYLCTAEITHVARAHCVRAKEPGGPVRLHILPHVEPADRWMRAEEFEPNGALLREVEALLDERKPVGANVDVLPAVVRAVTVVADVKIGPHEDVIRLEQDVLQALNVYLNPLIGGGSGTGWEFGRTLNVGELFGVVQAVSGVRYVNLLRMYESDLHTGDIVGEESGAHLALHAGQTLASGQHQVRVSRVKSAT